MRVERVPIRTTTRLTPGGEHRRELSIYCPFQAKTFPAAHCEHCTRLVSWTDDPGAEGASVICASEDARAAEEETESRAVALHFGDRMTGPLEEEAARTPIGVVMAATCITAEGELEIADLRRALGEKTGRAFPVVDRDGTLIGVVSADRLTPSVPAPPPSRPGMSEFLRRLVPTTVREVMTAHVTAFPEGGRVRDALNAMLVERVRYLPVVSAEGAVVGLVWDLDLLSWLARSHRPVEE
jgi:CBS domain-containing protein